MAKKSPSLLNRKWLTEKKKKKKKDEKIREEWPQWFCLSGDLQTQNFINESNHNINLHRSV